MEDLRERIVELLRKKAPLSLESEINEMEALIKQKEYRQAFLKMYEIKKDPSWTPTEEYLKLMEKFWAYYAA